MTTQPLQPVSPAEPAAAADSAPDGAAVALPSAVCDRVTRLGTAALGAPMASVAVAEGAMLYVASCRGFPTERGPRRGSPFGCPLSRHVFTTREPLAIDDVAHPPLGRGHAR